MKFQNDYKAMLPMVLAVSMLASSCVWNAKSGNNTVEDTDSVTVGAQISSFTVDSIHWEDSLFVGENKIKGANVCISGLYPVGGPSLLVDSTRAWIAELLSYGGLSNGDAQFCYDAYLLSDGKALIEAAGLSYLVDVKKDIDDMVHEGFFDEDRACCYEFSYSFKPVFCTDSILTYDFSGYTYMCGAHGSALGFGQTFAVSTGKRLDAEDMFLPENRLQLLDLIRDGLWKQYFMAENESGEYSSLKDALLISPDTLPLPACPPLCTDKGIVFIYQQYEIACYAAGMPACTLSYEALKPLMYSEVSRLMPE